MDTTDMTLDERVPGDVFRPAQEAWHQRWNDVLDREGADHAHTDEDYEVIVICVGGAGCGFGDGDALPVEQVRVAEVVR